MAGVGLWSSERTTNDLNHLAIFPSNINFLAKQIMKYKSNYSLDSDKSN